MDNAIYIDFDDVLCETALAFIDIVAATFGKNVAFEAIHTFDLAISFDLNREEYERLMHLGHQAEFLDGMQPVPGAIEGVKQWAEAGYRICIMTGRPPSTRPVSVSWLERYGVPFDELSFVDKYGRSVAGHDQDGAVSLDALRQRDFVLAVEDAPKMASWLCANMRAPVAVIERPWNQHAEIATGEATKQLHRCRNWEAIREQFARP